MEGETVPVEPKLFEADQEAQKEREVPVATGPSHGVLISRQTSESGRLFGRWSDAVGEPAARKRLTLHRLGADGIGNALMNVSTDEQGDYTAWLSPGAWLAKFQDDEYRLTVSAKGEHRQDHTSPSENSATVAVTVTGGSVQPWNALVTMSLESRGGSRQIMQGRTGKDGKVEFAMVRTGKAKLSGQLLRKAGGRPIKASVFVSVPESGVVEVILSEPSGRLSVEVLSDVDAAVVPGVTVEFIPQGESTVLASAISGENGRCQMNGIAPGDGILRIRHPEFVPMMMPETILNYSRHVIVHLSRGSKIPVTARAEDGTPMAIILRGRTLHEKPERVWEWRLDKEGTGHMDRLPLDSTEIELLAAGCESIRVNSAQLRADGQYEAVFKLIK
jgi:hypothetical protein